MKLIAKVFFIASIFSIPFLVQAQVVETAAQKELRLQNELAQVLKEQAETEKILADTQNKSASLSRDILILDTKIKAAQLNIKAKNLQIESLGKDITKKQEQITDLEDRIDRGKETLAQIMRKTNEIDSLSMPEFILARENLTTVLSDIDNFESVRESLKTTFEQIRDDKTQTETEKDVLDKRKNKEIDAKAVIEAEKKNIQNDEAEKKKLLTVSKGNEKTYSQILAQKKAKAAEIRSALFALAGGGKAIPFGDALNYANAVNAKTGVSQAFLLAILTQETGIGKNVGTCYLTNTDDGSGINSKNGAVISRVMKPTRDVQPFISITASLGLDYKKMVVSCPQAVGYGGGMGPAQFIASTWSSPSQSVENRISSKVAKALGKSIANPWDPQDAFMAAGIFLKELGANTSSYTAQKLAACKYYGGGTKCTTITTPYGNNVMALASTIQRTMIDPLQGL
jgi:peptidoglycan hydrolase CwlO-like protein